MSVPDARTIACPMCGKAAAWSQENRWRPFCSERCKLIDLGQWATEKYRVPVNPAEPARSATDDTSE